MVVLSITGNHVPVIPFVEVVERVIVPPEQIGAIGLKAGVVDGFTVTPSVVFVAHCPTAGVNVYVVVVVLSIAGDQVPLIPLLELVGSVIVPPEQIATIGLNVGVVDGFTDTLKVVVAAH